MEATDLDPLFHLDCTTYHVCVCAHCAADAHEADQLTASARDAVNEMAGSREALSPAAAWDGFP